VKTEPNILVVDDNADLLDNIALALESEDFRIFKAEDGVQALEILESNPVDLILADIAMPRMNGYQLHERVRQNPTWVMIPFVLLTARALDSDVRFGKEMGVDDYLIKPIQRDDLLAAVRGKLRRSTQLRNAGVPSNGTSNADPSPRKVGELEINSESHEAFFRGYRLALSAREFTLLDTLASKPGKVMSVQELIKITHNYETDHIEAGNLLRPLIRSLRRKLGYDVGDLGCIENIRGVGYRLKVGELE
jgi:DNA-binding response OmpR family regulator